MEVGSAGAGSRAVELTRGAAAAIRAAALASDPDEACGLLFGREGRISHASVARNVAAEPRHRFEIDPAHLFDGHRKGRAGPERLIGCWHSHPGGSAVPSAHDRDGALEAGWLWLIIGRDGIRGWRPAAHGFDPVPLLELAPGRPRL
jgi:proteasome lid subunit RPN8/RPN11